MDPRFYEPIAPLGLMSGTEDDPRRRRSRHSWPDIRRESTVPLNERIEVPSWDYEVFSGRRQAPHVAPVWETWLSSEAQSEEDDTVSSGTSASACHLCTKHSDDSDSTPSSGNHPFPVGGRDGNPAVGPSNLRLLGLTCLAALLVVVVVVTNAKINRIVLGSLETESPDATRHVKLVSRKPSHTEPGLPATGLPGSGLDHIKRLDEPQDDGEDTTAIAGYPGQSKRDADGTADEDTGPTGVTRSSSSLQTSPSDLGDGGDAGRTGEETPGRLQPRTNKPNCETVVYTYCPVARREFHYRASVNAYLATALDPMVQLCARGSNRFASRATCEHSCVFGYRPKDVCFDTPLFSGCDREDVNESWWYFEGGRCHLWSFPAGACPSNDSAVFTTAAECASRCAGRATALCGVPRPTACRRNQLRFPFFAHFTEPEGRMRCLRASTVLDAGHRCLDGSNRFASLTDCAEACASSKASDASSHAHGTSK